MTLWNRLQSIVRWIVRRDDEESRLNAELEAYLDIATAERIRQGIPPEEARRLARLELGGVEQTKERVRTGRHGGSLESLFQDVRIAMRMMRRDAGFTAITILTLAIGIGGITAIFSVVRGVLLRPAPFQDPDRIVRTAGMYTPPANGGVVVPLPIENDWPRRNDVFADVSLVTTTQFSLLEGGTADLVRVERVEPNFLSVLKMRPALGRDFEPSDEGDPRFSVAMMSYEFWQERFGGSIEILGKELKFVEGARTIIGILPRGFESPFALGAPTQLWTPASASRTTSIRMSSIARLRAGISPAQAEERLNASLRQIESEYPASNYKRKLQVRGLQQVNPNNRSLLALLFASVAFIFLIAVINVANLMLSRDLTRRREIAVRAAMGAGRGRLVRQLLTESALLALTGGILGIALAYGLLNLILSQIPQNFPHITSIYIDPQVLLFAASTSMLGAILFGSLPAWQFSNPDLQIALKEGAHQSSESRGTRWVRQCLLSTEIALSCVLLVGAALAVQTFWNTLNVPLGINSENVITAVLSMSADRYGTKPARDAFANAVIEAVRRHPEVQSAARSGSMPLSLGGMQYAFFPKNERVTDQDKQPPISSGVSPGYFDLLRIPFTSGKPFRDGEAAIVINEAFARQHWGEANPLGSQINVMINGLAARQFIVSGIVKDQNNPFFANFTTPTYPELFYPCEACGYVLIKGKSSSASLASILRKEVAAIDPTVPVTQLRLLDDAMLRSSKWAPPRFRSTLFTAFSLAALLLALAGAYGVTAYSATQRRREMAIRMTLGASHGQVTRSILFDSLRPVVFGVILGLTAAWNLSRFAVAFLYKVNPTDVRLFAIVAGALILAVVVANLLPIRRVVKLDPLESLRTE